MNVPDQPICITDTNSGIEYGGSVFGISLANFRWVIGALVLGFFAFLGMQGLSEVSTINALVLSFGPALICAVVLVVLVQGKHPSYASDLLETLVNRGHASPLYSRK
jgi:hypothetical protein